MTISVTKPSVNLREKLNELDQPQGLKGTELLRADTVAEARTAIGAGRKNLIINGAMQVAQRGTSATGVTANGYHTIDRYQFINNGSDFDLEQSTDAPTGFTKSLKATSNTSGTVGEMEYSFYRYYFEGQDIAHLNWGTANAKTVTLSFWVKSSIAGTHGVLVGRQTVAMYGVQYTISSANTWEYKTVTIPGATSGTFTTDNTQGFEIIFDLGVGSGYSLTAGLWSVGTNTFGVTGAVKLRETSGATLQITGLQLEVGSEATDFEHRSYGEELVLCQRYYQDLSDFTIYMCFNDGNTSTRVAGGLTFYTRMRTTPTITKNDGYLSNQLGGGATPIGVYYLYNSQYANRGSSTHINGIKADAEL